MKVEWVYPYLIKDKPAHTLDESVGIKPLRDIPVVRVEALRAYLEEVRSLIAGDLEACGDCDHTVNICVCGLKRAAEDTDSLLATLPKEA